MFYILPYFKYQSTGEFIRDVRRMFRNCREFWNQMDSDGVELFMGHADRMEDHFDERLEVIHSKNFQFVKKIYSDFSYLVEFFCCDRCY